VKPWVKSSEAIQASAGAAENYRTVLSVAPAGACDFCATKPTADRRGLFSAAPPALNAAICQAATGPVPCPEKFGVD